MLYLVVFKCMLIKYVLKIQITCHIDSTKFFFFKYIVLVFHVLDSTFEYFFKQILQIVLNYFSSNILNFYLYCMF